MISFKKPKIIQKITEKQKEQRSKFANQELKKLMLLKKRNKKLIRKHSLKFYLKDKSRFSKRFDLFNVWRTRGNTNENVYEEKSNYNLSCSVSGIIGLNFKSEFVFCNKSINSVIFTEHLESCGIIKELENKRNKIFYYLFKIILIMNVKLSRIISI